MTEQFLDDKTKTHNNNYYSPASPNNNHYASDSQQQKAHSEAVKVEENIENEIIAPVIIAQLQAETAFGNSSTGSNSGGGGEGGSNLLTLLLESGGKITPERKDYVLTLIKTEIAKYNERALMTNITLLAAPELSARRLFDNLFGMGKLQNFLGPDTEEVWINAPNKVYTIKRDDGRKVRVNPGFRDDAEVLTQVKKFAAANGRHIDENTPYTDLQLANGARMNIVIPPIAPHVTVTIRLHSPVMTSLKELVARGSLPRSAASFLAACVRARKGVLVGGAMSSGKTTLLNSLLACINPDERVIAIEEVRELQLERLVADCVSLQARLPNTEGAGEVTQGDLVRNSLRMRADWIVVGEIRSGNEAIQVLLSQSSGHKGLSSIHCDNPRAALTRLRTLAALAFEGNHDAALTELTVTAIQIVVYLEKERVSGQRRVHTIAEVVGQENGQPQLNEIFVTRRIGGRLQLVWTGVLPKHIDELLEVGLDWKRDITGLGKAGYTAAAAASESDDEPGGNEYDDEDEDEDNDQQSNHGLGYGRQAVR